MESIPSKLFMCSFLCNYNVTRAFHFKNHTFKSTLTSALSDLSIRMCLIQMCLGKTLHPVDSFPLLATLKPIVVISTPQPSIIATKCSVRNA